MTTEDQHEEALTWMVRGIVLGAASWGVAVPEADVWAAVEAGARDGDLPGRIIELVRDHGQRQGVELREW